MNFRIVLIINTLSKNRVSQRLSGIAKGFLSGCERVRLGMRKGSFGSAKGFVWHDERGSFTRKRSEKRIFDVFFRIFERNSSSFDSQNGGKSVSFYLSLYGRILTFGEEASPFPEKISS